MKKLMFVAAVAAMIGGANAAEYYDGGKCGEEGCATAYGITATLKTTAPKYTKKTTKDDCDPCESTTSCTYYLAQKTVKVAGYAYSSDGNCDDCDTLDLGEDMLLWNATDKIQLVGDLALYVGRYDKTGKKVEAYGTLTGDFGELALAGFGSMYIKSTKATKCDPAECYGYIKNISGNVAGYLTRYIEEDCEEPTFDCCDEVVLENAAASGTWKISYNSGVAKKLAKGYGIEEAANLPKYVDEDDAGTVTIEE